MLTFSGTIGEPAVSLMEPLPDVDEPASDGDGFLELHSANGPEGTFEWFPVRPGRWRVRDTKSGVASEDFELVAGDGQVVTLDFSRLEKARDRGR